MRFEIILLLSFITIIIGLIACSPPPNPTPTLPPTLFPTVTLTVYNPNWTTTLTPDSLPSATIMPANEPFDGIGISPPLCYPLNSGQITCLGYVDNQGETTVSNVTLRARYVSRQDDETDEQLFTLEQRVLGINAVAPYRLQIPNARLETTYIEIEVVSSELSAPPTLPLQLMDMQGMYHLEDNQYTFTAQLENTTAFDAIRVRLIVTLENENGDIIGYRVADIPDTLASGDIIPIELLMTPLEMTETIRHRITLEAFPIDTAPTPAG